jgi:hypothetical protein
MPSGIINTIVGIAICDAAEDKGTGWVLFAGIMLMTLGVLDVIYGIAAIGNSHFFVHNTHYVFGSLNTWGWVTLLVGAVQVMAAFSIWAGGSFGKWVGIVIAGLSAIAALLAIPAYPFLSLAIFAVDILIVYGLVVYGGRRTSA